MSLNLYHSIKVANILAKLSVTVLPSESDEERDDWLELSGQGFEAAYGDDEPEYSLEHLKWTNPEYDRR